MYLRFNLPVIHAAVPNVSKYCTLSAAMYSVLLNWQIEFQEVTKARKALLRVEEETRRYVCSPQSYRYLL